MNNIEEINKKKYQEKQEELKNNYIDEIIKSIDEYMGTLPINSNIIISESINIKYRKVQNIISQLYKKYYKKIDHIDDFDVRIEILSNGVYSVNIFEKKLKIKENS
jgi:hypothetical protein